MRRFNRLRIIGPAILVCAALLAACAPGGSAANKDEIVVLGYGGAYDEVLKKNAADFEKETGIHVTIVPHSGSDALVKARAKEADVVFTDPIWAFRGESEGLWEKLDGSNLNDLYKVARLSDYSVIHDFGAYGIAYNPDTVQPAPTSWNDLWNPKFKGHVILRSFTPDSIELLVLMAKLNGGSERDIDPGFAKMSQLGRNVNSWFGTHPQALELYRSGEATIGVWNDARTAWAKTQGANVKFVVPKEGAFTLMSVMTVVKGRPNTADALKYVNFELGQQAQERMAQEVGYFPANSTVKLAPEVQQKMALNPKNIESVQMADWKYIVTVLDQWQTRWEKEVLAGRSVGK
jgi:putative spermidine/putrescine transport system substrate-binding protein